MKEKNEKKKSINKAKVLLFLNVIIIALFLIFNVSKGKKVATEVNNVDANITQNQDENNSNQINDDTNNETIVVNSNTTSENKIASDSVNTKVSKVNSDEKLGAEGLPVMMYHFFYDKSKGETAKDGNWIEISNFEAHLKYLTENNYYFPTWEEVVSYIDGKISLPKKSIVITVDDGDESFFKVALPVVKKYDVKVTEFLVTSWNGWYKDDYAAPQMSYQSHSDNMHKGGADGKGVMMSWSYEQILKDCKDSRGVLGDEAIAFCYPFGQYNATSKKAVKDGGFKLAFTTEGGRVKVGADKMALPRVRTSTGTTLEYFKKLIQ